jgi:hypothetical protein
MEDSIMLRKTLILALFLISFLILTGCGGGSTPPSPPPSSKYTITINVFNKETKAALTGASLSVIETSQKILISKSSYQISLTQGKYSIYLTRDNYIPQGYIINLNGNITINSSLEPLNMVFNNNRYIAGSVNQNGNPYHDPFYGFVGNKAKVTPFDSSNNSDSFTVPSVCGDIVVSVFTMLKNHLDKVVYVKTNLPEGNDVFSLIPPLEISSSIIIYRVTGSDNFTVKLNNGCLLANQETACSDFSFLVNLTAEDSLVFESLKNTTDGNYFTRMNAGTGGMTNTSYQSEVPNFGISDSDNYYTINLTNVSSVSFASYFEVYGIEPTDLEKSKLTFRVACLNGTSVKVPKSLINSGTDTIIYVRAVKLDGMVVGQMLDGTQIYTDYSWTENAKILSAVQGSGLKSLSVIDLPAQNKAEKAIRKLYNLNNLCLE